MCQWNISHAFFEVVECICVCQEEFLDGVTKNWWVYWKIQWNHESIIVCKLFHCSVAISIHPLVVYLNQSCFSNYVLGSASVFLCQCCDVHGTMSSCYCNMLFISWLFVIIHTISVNQNLQQSNWNKWSFHHCNLFKWHRIPGDVYRVNGSRDARVAVEPVQEGSHVQHLCWFNPSMCLFTVWASWIHSCSDLVFQTCSRSSM